MGKMPHKLIYFNLRGRGQVMLDIMIDNEIPFEEEHVAFADWGAMKPTMLFGQLPKFIFDGGLELYQSNAIIRHLGRVHNLYGESPEEAAKVDMMLDSLEDLRMAYVKLIYTNYDSGKADYIKGIPAKLKPFEKVLEQNDGGKGFIVGKKISVADYALFDVLDVHEILAPGCLDSSPLVKAFYERIASRPKLAPYVSSEEYKNKQVNGNQNK